MIPVSILANQNFSDVNFLKSVFDLKQLPEPDMPEIAFAGRSNVGKSSLINRLIKRKNLVKTSAKPGKTQSLNFFLLDSSRFYNSFKETHDPFEFYLQSEIDPYAT